MCEAAGHEEGVLCPMSAERQVINLQTVEHRGVPFLALLYIILLTANKN